MPHKDITQRRLYQREYHRQWRAKRRFRQTSGQAQDLEGETRDIAAKRRISQQVEALRPALSRLEALIDEGGWWEGQRVAHRMVRVIEQVTEILAEVAARLDTLEVGQVDAPGKRNGRRGN